MAVVSHDFDLAPLGRLGSGSRVPFAMLRTSFGLSSRRLLCFHNTFPNVWRGQRSWSGQSVQHSFRRVSPLRAFGLFACAATAALVVYHYENPTVLLGAGPQTPETSQGPLLLLF